MKRAAGLLLLGALACAPARSQSFSASPSGDTRNRVIDFSPSQVVSVTATPGYQLTINFAPDERIRTAALGDTGAFQVTANQAGNTLFVKVLRPGATTNLTVATDARKYTLTLIAAALGDKASTYSISFRYPRAASQPISISREVGHYKLAGSRSLWPSRISDDGDHVFIEWPRYVDIPAIYALDGQGRESLTNGMMRGDKMVIDEIATRLVFRLDHEHATATRMVASAPKR